jgi:hypothetical protein
VVGACGGGLFDHLPHLLKQNRFNIEFATILHNPNSTVHVFVVYLVGVLVCCSSNLHSTSLLGTAYKYCMMGCGTLLTLVY